MSASEDRERYISKIAGLNEYQIAAMRTQAPHNDLTCAALGLSGEGAEALLEVMRLQISTGNFADLIKKHTAHGHALDRVKSAKELGDALWYIALAANRLGYTLEQIGQMNITKLAERYPEGFTVAASKHDGT